MQSRQLVRGIDEYMAAASQVLDSATFTRYEMLDIDIQIHKDVGIVFYVARDWMKDGSSKRSVLLRSVDIYRRDANGWNQCGSNICTLPDGSANAAFAK